MTDARTTDSIPCAVTSSPRNFMVILGIGRTSSFKKQMKVLLLLRILVNGTDSSMVLLQHYSIYSG